jgi:hypothetical protein
MKIGAMCVPDLIFPHREGGVREICMMVDRICVILETQSWIKRPTHREARGAAFCTG